MNISFFLNNFTDFIICFLLFISTVSSFFSIIHNAYNSNVRYFFISFISFFIILVVFMEKFNNLSQRSVGIDNELYIKNYKKYEEKQAEFWDDKQRSK